VETALHHRAEKASDPDPPKKSAFQRFSRLLNSFLTFSISSASSFSDGNTVMYSLGRTLPFIHPMFLGVIQVKVHLPRVGGSEPG
jgi:hypothetical protein